MIYYIILFAIVIASYYIIKNKKCYALFITLLLFVMTAFRDSSLGLGDVEKVYYTMYDMFGQMSFKYLFALYDYNDGILYILLIKLLTIFDWPRIIILISSVPMLIGSYLLITKYSKNYLQSYIVFLSLFYFFSFVMIRQAFAIGLVLIGVYFLLQDKKWLFGFFVVLATGFHFSAIVTLALLIYPYFIKKGILNLSIIGVCLTITLFFKDLILSVIELIFPKYYHYILKGIYSLSSNLSLWWLLVLFVFFGLFYFVNSKDKTHFLIDEHKTTKNEYVLFSSLSLAIITYIFSGVVKEFYRISYYFSFLMTILAPNLINKINNKKLKMFISLSMVICCILYFFLFFTRNYNIINYAFSLK